MNLKNVFLKKIGNNLSKNTRLSNYSWFYLGGNGEFFFKPNDNNQLMEFLAEAKNNNLKTVKIIGNFHGTISYEKQKKIIKKFGWSFRLAGFDALNYCLLAEGKVDAVIEANLKQYDILPR
mgnify:CR=1 FL=1